MSDFEFEDVFAVDAARTEADAAMKVAQQLQVSGDVAGAFQKLLFVVRKHAGNTPPNAVLQCGTLALQVGDKERALNCYDLFLSKDPNNYQVRTSSDLCLWLRFRTLQFCRFSFTPLYSMSNFSLCRSFGSALLFLAPNLSNISRPSTLFPPSTLEIPLPNLIELFCA